jgi:phosphatidylglycerol---prolipoprotein diacylglyceryl transferase
MYPNLHFALKEWFGVDWQWAKIFNSFGLLLAISFIAAAIVLSRELRRREKLGFLGYREEKIVVGEPASVGELLVHFLIGFLLGFKFIGGLVDGGLLNDPQSYIQSSQGNWFIGIALGGLMAFFKWREKNKLKLDKPEQRVVRIWPHDRVGDITIISAVAGLLGAKLFDNFENWNSFVKDPLGSLVSPTGLTFYGGLILAPLAVIWYARRKNINLWHLCDSAAPAIMIAYAIGRIGCQVSGDGDWGIYNSAYVSTPDAKVVLADSSRNFQTQLKDTANTAWFNNDLREFGEVPHASFKAPSFIPRWMVAMNYAHNVNEAGVKIANCDEKYCTMLPVAVFPTPFYETVICTIFFFVLLRLRRTIKIPGVIFGIYLILNGIERFFVEKIRVNVEYNILGMKPSQAEIIAVLLIIGGALLVFFRRKAGKPVVGQ